MRKSKRINPAQVIVAVVGLGLVYLAVSTLFRTLVPPPERAPAANKARFKYACARPHQEKIAATLLPHSKVLRQWATADDTQKNTVLDALENYLRLPARQRVKWKLLSANLSDWDKRPLEGVLAPGSALLRGGVVVETETEFLIYDHEGKIKRVTVEGKPAAAYFWPCGNGVEDAFLLTSPSRLFIDDKEWKDPRKPSSVRVKDIFDKPQLTLGMDGVPLVPLH